MKRLVIALIVLCVLCGDVWAGLSILPQTVPQRTRVVYRNETLNLAEMDRTIYVLSATITSNVTLTLPVTLRRGGLYCFQNSNRTVTLTLTQTGREPVTLSPLTTITVYGNRNTGKLERIPSDNTPIDFSVFAYEDANYKYYALPSSRTYCVLKSQTYEFLLCGGGGGPYLSAPGGGGRVTTQSLALTAGQTLSVTIGSAGGTNTNGGSTSLTVSGGSTYTASGGTTPSGGPGSSNYSGGRGCTDYGGFFCRGGSGGAGGPGSSASCAGPLRGGDAGIPYTWGPFTFGAGAAGSCNPGDFGSGTSQYSDFGRGGGYSICSATDGIIMYRVPK